MKRTKKIKQASAILCSDWHLREDTPICRTDDFEEAQWNKVSFVADLQKKHNCPILHAGDLFHHWKPSPRLLSLAIRHLPDRFGTIYGQHDLPQHSLQLAEKCGINTLIEAGKIGLVNGAHWGEDPNKIKPIEISGRKILVWHHLTYVKTPFPGASGGMAEGVLRKYKQYDLILTGDNHQAFTTEYKGRLLVNPGNLTRQDADQINFQPRVYLWYADTNTVKPVYLPIKEGVVSRVHIEKKEERGDRISAFIEKLNNEWDTVLDFRGNLKRFEESNNIDKKTMEIVYKATEEV